MYEETPIKDMGGFTYSEILAYMPQWHARKSEWIGLGGADRALWFWRNVRDGGIPSCRRIKQAANRFFDLQKRHVWDPLTLDRVVDRIERFAAPDDSKGFGDLTVIPWQAAFLSVTHGLKTKYGDRLIREVLLVIPRASGKSSMVAAITLLELAVPFAGKVNSPKIWLTAISEGTAELTLDKCTKILELDAQQFNDPDRNPDGNRKGFAKRNKMKTSKRKIVCQKNGGFIEIKSLAARNLDGVRLHMAAIDELSNITDISPIETLRTGTGHTDNSLYLLTTTTGDKWSSSIDPELEFAERVLDGDEKNDTRFAFLFRATEEEYEGKFGDPRTWEAVNPSLSWTTSLKDYYEKWTMARGNEDLEHKFYTRQLCATHFTSGLFLSPKEALETTKNNPMPEIDPALANMWLVGLDLSESSDMSGLCVIGHDTATNKTYAWFKAYAPAKILPGDEVTTSEARRIRKWRKEGHIHINGAKIDHAQIAQDLTDLHARLKFLRILSDTQTSLYHVQEACPLGMATLFRRTGKSPDSMAEPIHFLCSGARDGNLFLEPHPVFIDHLSNVVIDENRAGGLLPIKESKGSRRHIDLVDALLMGLHALIDAKRAMRIGDRKFPVAYPRTTRNAEGSMEEREPMPIRFDIKPLPKTAEQQPQSQESFLQPRDAF